MGLGLIGTALAGAASGVGDAAMEQHKQQIQLERERVLMEMKQQGDAALEATRQEGSDRRLGVSETGAQNRLEAGFKHSETQQTGNQKFLKKENKATRDQALELAEMTNDRITSDGRLTREQQSQNHTERMAQMKDALKNQGLSLSYSKEGLQIIDAKTGTATLVTGADGKPVHQLKEDDSFNLITALTKAAENEINAGNLVAAKKYNTIVAQMLEVKAGGAKTTTTVDPAQFDPNRKKEQRAQKATGIIGARDGGGQEYITTGQATGERLMSAATDAASRGIEVVADSQKGGVEKFLRQKITNNIPLTADERANAIRLKLIK